MIGRIWHGWTRLENADEYERLLKEEIFPGIVEKKVPGYRGIQLFRAPVRRRRGGGVRHDHELRLLGGGEAILRRGPRACLRAPEGARGAARFDERSRHYEIRERLDY